MDKNPTIVVGAINIAANPHPEGIYRRLFDHVATIEINIHGSDWGKITKVSDLTGRDGVFHGRVLLWAKIDKRGKWINKDKDDEATAEDKKKISIPEAIEPNMRSFVFVFDQNKHRIIIEYKNDEDQGFGPKRASKFFSRLFAPENLWEGAPEVAVTTVPTEDALARVLAIPRLRRLRIHNTIPNDDLGDDAERIQERLKKMGAKSQDTELHKAAKVKKLEPDGQIKALAEAALENGFVEGFGRDETGKNVYESTELHPKTVTVKMEGESSFAAFLSAMRTFL